MNQDETISSLFGEIESCRRILYGEDELKLIERCATRIRDMGAGFEKMAREAEHLGRSAQAAGFRSSAESLEERLTAVLRSL